MQIEAFYYVFQNGKFKAMVWHTKLFNLALVSSIFIIAWERKYL